MGRMRLLHLTVLVLAALGTVSAIAPRRLLQQGSNLVVNGNFEEPGQAGLTIPNQDFIQFQAGSTSLTGWTIEAGNIDYVRNTVWEAVGSSFSVDVTGDTPGTISQVIQTTPGQQYTLTFNLAGSTGGAAIKRLQVTAGDQTQVAEFDITGKSVSDLGYVAISLPFTATAAETKLTFQALNSGIDGPIIDDVAVLAGAGTSTPLGNVGPVSAPLVANTVYNGTASSPTTALAPASTPSSGLTPEGAPAVAPAPEAAFGPNEIVGQFTLNSDATTVNNNITRLQDALASELATPNSLPEIVSIAPGPTEGTSVVTFSIVPAVPGTPIPADEVDNVRQAFEVLLMSNERLELPLFGEVGPFSVVQFPGGVYSIAPGAAPGPASTAALTATPLVGFVLDKDITDVAANQDALKAQLSDAMGLKPSEVVTLDLAAVPANTTGDANVGDTAVTANVVTVGTFANNPARLAEISRGLNLAANNSLGLDPATFGAPGGVQLLLPTNTTTTGPDMSFVLDRDVASVLPNSAALQAQLAQNLGLGEGESVGLSFSALPATTVGNATLGDTLVNATFVLPPGAAADRPTAIVATALSNIASGNFSLDSTLFGNPQLLTVNPAYANTSSGGGFILDKPLSFVQANQAELNRELAAAAGSLPGQAVITTLTALPANTTGSPAVGDTLVNTTLVITPGGPVSSATAAAVLAATLPGIKNGSLGLDPTLFGLPAGVTLGAAGTVTPLLGFVLDKPLASVVGNSSALTAQLAQTFGLRNVEGLSADLSAAGANATNVGANLLALGGLVSSGRLQQIAGNLTSSVSNGTLGLNPAVFGNPRNLTAGNALQALGIQLPRGQLLPGVPNILLPATPTTGTGSGTTTGNATATPASGSSRAFKASATVVLALAAVVGLAF